MRNPYVAAAVAAALATAAGTGTALATPTATTAKAAQSIYIAGSSAAAGGIIAYLENTVCGGPSGTNNGTGFAEWNTDTSVAGDPDFRAVSCVPVAGQPFAGTLTTFYYRPEGGSVTGVFPEINHLTIAQLDLTSFTSGYANNGGFNCPQSPAANSTNKCNLLGAYNMGTSGANGPGDNWTAGVIYHNADIGVSDLEPAAFGNGAGSNGPGGGNNDPANYQGTQVYTFTGQDRSVDDLSNSTLLPQAPILQQTFGFVVNSNLGITDLPKEALAAIFTGSGGITNSSGEPDWSLVNKGGAGGKVTSTSTEIIVCNREVGSGTRAETDLWLTDDGCNLVGTVAPLFDYSINGITNEPANNYATALELTCVNGHQNSIGYVSIDNFSKLGTGNTYPSVNAITVNGVTASNLNAALGVYSDVYEAFLNENTQASSNGKAFYTDLLAALQNVNTTANQADITAIPDLVTANKVQYPPQQVGSDYTSNFTRSGNSCTPLTKDQ